MFTGSERVCKPVGMAALVSGNPALEKARNEYFTETDTRTMTVGGTAAKTLFFLLLALAAGAWGWASAVKPVANDIGGGYGNVTVTIPMGFWFASFAALFCGIFAAVNPRRAAPLGALYALLQGYCLGVISAAFNAQTAGIVAAAILGTVGVFLVALFLYVTRIVRPTQKMAFAVVAGLGGLFLLYFFIWILAIADASFLSSEQYRTWGIAISLIAVILAALSLTLDFGTIEAGVDGGAPKFLEWYCAYSLMVTLIWLYITLLRLFAILARNS
jgi:uncharacterized YccA/Bax inhibitor family protein